MCELSIPVVMSKIAADDLQIRVSQESLKSEDSNAIAQHADGKSPAEIVKGRLAGGPGYMRS